MQIEVDIQNRSRQTAQLVAQVKRAVLRQELDAGDPLPTARQLAHDLGIGPETVARAYRRLEEESVIDGRILYGPRVRRGARPRLGRERDHAAKIVELEEARELQRALLPETPPSSTEFDLAADLVTAGEIGGDLYDFETGGSGELTIVLADAVGHGARAATLAATAKGMLTLTRTLDDLAERLRVLDDALRRMALRRASVSLLLCRLTLDGLEVASAGMPPPLVYRAETGEVDEIPVAGAALGSPLRTSFATRHVPFAPGDALLLSSDGLPESRRADGDPLGYDGALARFARVATSAPRELVRALLDGVRAGARGGLDDDVTLVAARRRRSG